MPEVGKRIMASSKEYYEVPYAGAKVMLLVDNIDNRDFLHELLKSMYMKLPKPKSRKISAAFRPNHQ